MTKPIGHQGPRKRRNQLAALLRQRSAAAEDPATQRRRGKTVPCQCSSLELHAHGDSGQQCRKIPFVHQLDNRADGVDLQAWVQIHLVLARLGAPYRRVE